jgi:hypothetical protein
MNRAIKEATVKRYHHDCHRQLEDHLQDFIQAYNFARRLKMLQGMTPYENSFVRPGQLNPNGFLSI